MNDDFAESMSNRNTAYILATSPEFMQEVRRRLPSIPFPEPERYPVILVSNADTLGFRLFYEAPSSAFVPPPEEPAYVA